MTRASALTSPEGGLPEDLQSLRDDFYAEPVVQFADGVTVPRSMYGRDPRWCGIGVPEFASEARAAAKGQVTASGVPGFVAPPVDPISESSLEKALQTVEAARDRLMRSRREE